MTSWRSSADVDAAVRANRPWVIEFRVMHADGSIHWVHERGVKTVDRDGSEWIDGIMFDVTERRAAEQLRVERELEAQRVAELEASRVRIIAAADEARRRIERDLHDGAQQRLVVTALLLRTAEDAAEPGSRTATVLRAARAELDAGLAELRARVEVADDGRGGADPANGSGLRGLQDRLSAIDGTLALDSPPERGTRLRANVPLPT